MTINVRVGRSAGANAGGNLLQPPGLASPGLPGTHRELRIVAPTPSGFFVDVIAIDLIDA